MRGGGWAEAAFSLARADREFGEATAAEEARTYLEELAATSKLIETEGAMDIASVETLVNEMNLQANVASSIISGAQSSIGNAINTTKNIEAARRAGQVSVGEFFSGLAAGAITQITSGAISNAMNPGGGLFGSQSAGGDTSGFGSFGGGGSGGPGARGVGTTSSGGGGGGAAGMMPFVGSFFGG